MILKIIKMGGMILPKEEKNKEKTEDKNSSSISNKIKNMIGVQHKKEKKKCNRKKKELYTTKGSNKI